MMAVSWGSRWSARGVARGSLVGSLFAAVVLFSPAPGRAQKTTALDPHAFAGAPPAKGAPGVDGIVVGAPMATVDAKCKSAGVSCTKRVRQRKTITVDRVRVDTPKTSPFSRIWVTGKDGVILGVRGHYRTGDKDRHQALRTLFGGHGAARHGAQHWALPDGVVASLNPTGRVVTYIDTKAAVAKGIPLNAKLMTTPAPRREQAALVSSGSTPPHSVVPGRIDDLTRYGNPSPIVTNPLRIPVTITLGDVTCGVEDDPTSVFHGDDPYFHIVGNHTRDQMVWLQEKHFDSDVESGGTLRWSQVIFPDANDPRRYVARDEAVGVQFGLFEQDSGSDDDEIDYGYVIVDYAYALANQNKTIPYTEYLDGDGAEYTLKYTIRIGVGSPDPSANAPRFSYRPFQTSALAGSYAGVVGNAASEATLTFLASRDVAFPTGTVYGTITDGATTVKLVTSRLQGANMQLVGLYPNGARATFDLYEIGDDARPELTGSVTSPDGTVRGVALHRK